MYIQGPEVFLDSLSNAQSEGFQVHRFDEKYFIQSSEFEQYGKEDAKEVNKIGSRFVSILTGIYYWKFDIKDAIKVCGLYRLNDTGGKDAFLFAEPIVCRTTVYPVNLILKDSEGNIVGKSFSNSTLVDFEKVKSNPKAEFILRLISSEGWEFSTMYKIIEIIQSDMGGKIYSQVSRDKITLLNRTACHVGAIGDKARHGHTNQEPPPVPMSLDEAKGIVRGLIGYYFQNL